MVNHGVGSYLQSNSFWMDSYELTMNGDPSNAFTPHLFSIRVHLNLTFGSGWSLWTWVWDSVATQTPTSCNLWHFAKDWKVVVAPLAIWVERLLKRWCSYHVLGSKMGGESALWKAQIGGVWLRDHHPRNFFWIKAESSELVKSLGFAHCWIEMEEVSDQL